MTQKIFVNIPVADVAQSTALYAAIGAVRDPMFSNDQVSMMAFSDAITIMLLSHEHMRQFTSKTIADPRTTVQTLICLSSPSREAVDATLAQALAAGAAEDKAAAQDFGFMYGRRFEDLDGHSIDVMHLDLAQMQAACIPHAAA